MKTTHIEPKTRRGLAVFLLLAVMAVGSASATIVKNFEFSSDGVLPSADPEIIYIAPSGNLETDVFSVSGGAMTGNTTPNGGQPVKYSYPGDMYGAWPTNGGISPTEPWMVEIRARVLYQEGGQYIGAFTLWNGRFRFRIFLTDTGVRVNRAGPITYVDYPCNNTQWVVLKMWSDDGQFFSASVNGVVFADHQSGINDANILNGFFLQVNPHGENAHLEWDYVRFESGMNAISTEEVSFGELKALYR